MWRIYRNSLVERDTAADCERGQWRRSVSEITRMFPERTSWMRVRMPVENRRGIISVTKRKRTFKLNHLQLGTLRKASVTTEDKKGPRADQTEERVRWQSKNEYCCSNQQLHSTLATNTLEVDKHVCKSQCLLDLLIILLPRTVLCRRLEESQGSWQTRKDFDD